MRTQFEFARFLFLDRHYMKQKQQGVVLDDKNQEQPADKDRAQTAHKTEEGDGSREPKKTDKKTS
jgi:hypothetical protein